MKLIIIVISVVVTQLQFVYGQWYPLYTPSDDNLVDIYFINTDTGIVVSIDGNIFRTEDGGTTWDIIYSTNIALSDISMPSSETGYVVGNNGILLKTIDGGNTWTELYSGVSDVLRDVYFFNDSVGFYCGQSQVIAKTVDGGMNWNINSYGSYWLRDFAFINNGTGFCVGDGGTIMKTINYGETWFEVYSGTDQNLIGLTFVNNNTGYICGTNGTILKSTNSGDSWFAQESGTNNYASGVFFLNPDEGYVVGLNELLLKTTNGGDNWIKQTAGVSGRLFRVFFQNDSTGYITAQNGIVLKTCLPPLALFDYASDDSIVQFFENSLYAESWYWDFGDNYFSSEMNPVHKYDTSGEYLTCLYVYNLCGSASICKTISVYEEKPEMGLSLIIFPNPVVETLTIEIYNMPEDVEELYVELFDNIGRLINLYKFKDNLDENYIDVSFYADGLYYLKMIIDEKSFLEKFVVCKY